MFSDFMSVLIQLPGEVRGVCVTRKVLCESWVAESLDDAIVRALSTSQGRSGGGSHEEVCGTVRDLVTNNAEDRSVGGHFPSDRCETRGNPNVGDAKGTEPPSRSAGRAANPCALGTLTFVGGCIAETTRAWRGRILERVRPVHLEIPPGPSLFTWIGLAENSLGR